MQSVADAEGEQAALACAERAILLAEDNEINQQIAIELLEGAGATVKVANNGREAVEILLERPGPPPFDLVLMDLQMPEMDGYQATAKIRSDPRFGNLPIIAMTAHATIEERQRCLAAGMNDHISKPIDPALLFETVGRFYKPVAQASASGIGTGGAASLAPAPDQAIPAIDGLDTKDGLTRVAGNRKLYLKLLRQFPEQQGFGRAADHRRAGQGDVPLAERLRTRSKAWPATSAPKPVQAAAGVGETHSRPRRRSRNGSRATAGRRRAGSAAGRNCGSLRCVRACTRRRAHDLASSGGSRASARRRGAVDETAVRIRSRALEFIEANQAALRPLFPGDAWPQFEKLVQGYAFADAQAQLEQAFEEPGPRP